MRAPGCVGALIRNDEGRVFVQRRSATRRVLPGIWDIVGGHLEVGESVHDALAREIREETGWLLRGIGQQVADWEWEFDGVIRRELDYLVEVDGDLTVVKLEDGKHDRYAWIGLDNLHVMTEGRSDGDCRLRDIVARAINSSVGRTDHTQRNDQTCS